MFVEQLILYLLASLVFIQCVISASLVNTLSCSAVSEPLLQCRLNISFLAVSVSPSCHSVPLIPSMDHINNVLNVLKVQEWIAYKLKLFVCKEYLKNVSLSFFQVMSSTWVTDS